ncbi:MAG: ArsR family transcriptional regulator [Pyrobaculum sp.]
MERALYGSLVGGRRDIVLLLYKEGPMTLAKIRSRTSLSASSLLYELSVLESLGVIRREDTLVYLTQLGEKVASIISSATPLKSLNFLSLIGLRPLVVWIILSPFMRHASIVIMSAWLVSLVAGAYFAEPPLTLLGVMYYAGYSLPFSIRLTPQWSLALSLLSLFFLTTSMYFLSRRKLTPSKIVIGLLPLALYPALHLAFVQAAIVTDTPHLITLSQILLFFMLLLTATVSATVYSIETASLYESVLIRTLLIFFVVPALVYLVPFK